VAEQTQPEQPSRVGGRTSRRQFFVAAAIVAAMGLALTVALVTSYVRSAPLRGEGLISAQALVEDFDRNRRRSDEVSVSYEVEGQGRLAADIPVREHFDPGETVEVRYSPDQPELVRTVIGWAPSYTAPPLILLVIASLLIMIVCLVGGLRAPRRPDGDVGESGSTLSYAKQPPGVVTSESLTADGDGTATMRRLPWWVYVLLLLAVIGGVLFVLVRRDEEVSPLMIVVVVLAGGALVTLRVLMRGGAYAFGRELRRRSGR
jgi:hypothetical protein